MRVVWKDRTVSGDFRALLLRLMIWLGLYWRNWRGATIDSSERWSGLSQVVVLVRSLPIAGAELVGSDCCHDSLHIREFVAYCVS